MRLSLYIKEFFNAIKLGYNQPYTSRGPSFASQISKIWWDTYNILNSDKELNQNIVDYLKIDKKSR